MSRSYLGCVVLGVFFLSAGALPAAQQRPGIYRAKFGAAGKYLLVELLDDHIAHFELSASLPGPDADSPIRTTPMVARTVFPGPKLVKLRGRNKNILETEALSIEVDTVSLCLNYKDKIRRTALTRVCPLRLNEYWKGLTLSRGTTRNLYGLGQEFRNPGQPDGDWMGRVRRYGGLHGNKMVHFNGGDSANTQIPILYALGEGNQNYAFFLDQVYQQQWDFSVEPGKVEMYGDHIRWYLIAGPSLPSLRKSYLDLVGHPLVPPKKMFGLWISEFGYRNWGQLDYKLAGLRANRFPVDGFLVDLFWFGGVKTDSDDTPMGKLEWDTRNFPAPENKLRQLRDESGVGIMTIEESYIGKNLSEHRELEKNGYLVKDSSGKAAYLTSSTWWGKGAMIDWTNPKAGSFWHAKKRMPLIEAGLAGHWLDLGEPEIFHEDAVYDGGLRQADVHNLYNLHWLETIYRGYQAQTPSRRPFLLTRSGAAGVQRYGAAMWSGDIGSNLDNLASHQNAQMHMSLSGVDFYGSDIGGFHRGALQGDLNEMYTQWFAYGMLFDIPGRPHVFNLNYDNETSPDRIGDLESNRENLRWRHRLIPYTYSLAHRAHLYGEPIFPPPVYYFQSDANVRTLGREKMIGPSLLAAVVARHGQRTVSVYLPEGKWMDFYTGKSLSSRGESFDNISLYPEGYFRLPLFARAGALIPLNFVDDKTMNAPGRRTDGSQRDELIVRVFSDTTPSQFTLFEDDGESADYRDGGTRQTLLRQSMDSGIAQITIGAGLGDFNGAGESRNNVVELVHANAIVEGISLNTRALPKIESKTAWENSESGWFSESPVRTLIKSGVLPVETEKNLLAVLR